MTNKVFSNNDPLIVNGAAMCDGDFGIVRKVNPHGCIKTNSHVYKTTVMQINVLIRLENGFVSDKPNYYEVEIKDQLKLQRIK